MRSELAQGCIIFIPSSTSPAYTPAVTMNGVSWIPVGVCSLGGRVVITASPVTSSGAPAMKSRYRRSTRGASAIGWNAAAKATVGPTSYRRKVNDVTTPKLPPPPRMVQNRSALKRCGAIIFRLDRGEKSSGRWGSNPSAHAATSSRNVQ